MKYALALALALSLASPVFAQDANGDVVGPVTASKMQMQMAKMVAARDRMNVRIQALQLKMDKARMKTAK